jgi:hypothetical protein
LQLKSRTVARITASDSKVQNHSLFLVAPRKSGHRPNDTKSGGRSFSAKETRHSFAIWKRERSAAPGGYEQFYFCVRCKWTFGVNGRSSLVAALHRSGEAIQGPEALERLETFANGPCPAFEQIVGDDRPVPEPGRPSSFHKNLGLALSVIPDLARGVFSGLAGSFSALKRR